MIYVVLFFAGMTAGLCTILIFHPDYDDGLFGKVALTLLATAGYARLWAGMDFLAGATPVQTVQYTSIGTLIWIGLGIFLSRHYVRFLHFTREKNAEGDALARRNRKMVDELNERNRREGADNTDWMAR